MRSHFTSDAEREQVVNVTGMPCTANPSDHVPIASVFRWTDEWHSEQLDFHTDATNSASSSGNHDGARANSETSESVLDEAMSLLTACPISDHQKDEFEATLIPYSRGIDGVKKSGKPAQVEIDYYQRQRERKEVTHISLYIYTFFNILRICHKYC